MVELISRAVGEEPAVLEAGMSILLSLALCVARFGWPDLALVTVTGQMVVETWMVTVVRMVELAGQFLTVEAQLMIVETLVV